MDRFLQAKCSRNFCLEAGQKLMLLLTGSSGCSASAAAVVTTYPSSVRMGGVWPLYWSYFRA